MAEDPEDDDSSVPLRSIRALARGLEALEALNMRAPASVTDVARATALPRTTAYRVLETLSSAGYAERTADDRYRLLPRVHRLSDGFEAPPWIEQIVKPATAALVRDLSWPLLFGVLHGTEMRGYFLGPEPRVPERFSLLASSMGLAYLAGCNEAQRVGLQTLLLHYTQDIASRLEESIRRGATLWDDGGATLSLAVPVTVHGFGVGALAMTFARDAHADQAVDRFTALLAAAAGEIAAAWPAI